MLHKIKKIGFSSYPDFNELSVRDLLDAREHYHVHLSNKENVVATAVGRYLIRKKDPDAKSPSGAALKDVKTYKPSAPRTLANTVVQPWSWPCVLVFVSEWLAPRDFDKRMDQAVPKFLYLPDGRVVPTCVVLVESADAAPPPLVELRFPDTTAGGGYPLLSDVQGNVHVGSAGCLVTDGNLTFALTNRHVAGAPGSETYSLMRGERRPLGVSDELQLGKYPVSDVYPGYPDSHALINLDAGLVRVDSVNEWTAQVLGIGEVGPLVDINTETISLDLIGAPLKAFGAASGPLQGQIQALFYRYQSLGGVDYITDFLIGARDAAAPLATRPGDSGTLWFLDEPVAEAHANGKAKGAAAAPTAPPQGARPIALQWGGHRFISGGGEQQFQFALAGNLSAICRLLDVRVVRDWNRGLPEYWGKVGHYKIGYLACTLLSTPKLKKLFTANADRVGIDDAGLKNRSYDSLDKKRFVPLADVPDELWRGMPARAADKSNHFADMDEEGAGEFEGMTLLDICKKNSNVDVAVWNRFYASIGASKRGAVPFRVWQICDKMVEFASQGDVTSFVCAGGIMGHYVGDCGQSLHISRYHHGRPDQPAEEDVHSVYETDMLKNKDNIVKLFAGLATAVQGKSATPDVETGHGAAVGLIKLMRQTIKRIPPLEVIESYNSASGTARVIKMWDDLGARTCTSIAASALYLATLWESAWKEGNGNAIPNTELTAIPEADLRKLYMDTDFIKSYTLRQMEQQQVLGEVEA